VREKGKHALNDARFHQPSGKEGEFWALSSLQNGVVTLTLRAERACKGDRADLYVVVELEMGSSVQSGSNGPRRTVALSVESLGT